ncbi:MAG: NAAT family transporter [Phycisphaerae bacterium]|nr:NAAT family transporter [Phycisphaerae bacterium]
MDLSFWSAVVILLMVMDPLGNMPVFSLILNNVDPKRRKKVLIRELCIALVVLILFLFVGHYVMAIMHIEKDALTVAGGVILFLIALKMLFTGSEDIMGGHNMKDEPFIFPMAIPLIAGPSAMALLMLWMANDKSHWPKWSGALLLAWFISSSVLMASEKICNFIGHRGIRAAERLMGMILTTIAIQMLFDGVKGYIGSFGNA